MKKQLTVQEAKEKIRHYCAYQERSHLEVKNKLYELGLMRDEIDEIITHLISENYLNEERFAKAFAGGKFRLKKWGRIKIVTAMEAKGLTKNCIKIGLKEIDEEEYRKTLMALLEDKSENLLEENVFVKRDKLSQYAIGKGYEPEIVWKILRDILPD